MRSEEKSADITMFTGAILPTWDSFENPPDDHSRKFLNVPQLRPDGTRANLICRFRPAAAFGKNSFQFSVFSFQFSVFSFQFSGFGIRDSGS